MILVDSSVLIDLLEKSADWFEWSSCTLYAASKTDQLAINAVVFAEISRSFASYAAQNMFLKSTGIAYVSIPAQASYLAAQAHRKYRAAGGAKVSTLPDFFIGAHAHVTNSKLITRDAIRMQTYFADVLTISPR